MAIDGREGGSSSGFRAIRALIASLVLVAASASVVWAASSEGNQNPDLLVHAEISPDCITPGQPDTQRFSVENRTGRAIRVTVRHRWWNDSGWSSADMKTVVIRRSATWTDPDHSRTADSGWEPGTWHWEFSATNRNGTSSATVSWSVQTACL
jgi:hypothetical protein